MDKTIGCPAYLDGKLQERWRELAPVLQKIGSLDRLNVDVLAKYILAENEYLRVSGLVQTSLNRSDAEDANKWIAAQDRLTRQIITLAAELGMTPESRRARGFRAPI